MGDQSRQATWAGEVGTGVVSLHPAGKRARVGIPGPTDRAQPLVHVQLWLLIPAGKRYKPSSGHIQALLQGIAAKVFFVRPPWRVMSTNKWTRAPSSEVTLSYSLGHCRQSFVFLYWSLWL